MKRNQDGFGIIEIVLIVVMVGVIGAVGLSLYNQTVAKKANDTAAQQAVAATKQEATSAERKRYCDDRAGLCFQYPANWTIESSYSSARDSASAYLVSSDKKARVMYVSNYVKDGGDGDVTPMVLENSKGLAGYYISGSYSYATRAHKVVYDFMDGNVASSGATIGVSAPGIINPRFEYNGAIYKLSAWPLEDYTTADSAKQWFTTDNAVTILEIFQSFGKK